MGEINISVWADTCARCRISGISDDVYQRTIREYVESLPEDGKAAPEIYRRRLSVCADCVELSNGVCRQCGCFVAARAAKKRAICARGAGIWPPAADAGDIL